MVSYRPRRNPPMTIRRCTLGVLAALLITASSILLFGRVGLLQNNALPTEISDAEFWRIISDFSEPNGTYRFENFVSNEASIQNVIPALKRMTKPGGVYLGVAAE